MSIPKFAEWINEFATNEPAPEQGMMGARHTPGGPPQSGSGVSLPQHSQDDDSLDISAVVERRLQMLLDELEKKRKRPKDELVQVFSSVLQKLMNMGMTKGIANRAVKNIDQGSPNVMGGAGSQSPPQQPQVSA